MSKPTHEQLESLLQLPSERTSPLRVVMDTDFNNEIDDFFALTYLLLPNDQIEVEAIYAAPFSFKERLESLLAANELIKSKVDNLTDAEEALVSKYKGQIESIEKLGINPEDLLKPGSHVALTPEEGMETSYDELVKFMKLFPSLDIPIYKGATNYLQNDCPQRSEAVTHLINLARNASEDDPIYVLGLACATNLASAVMIAPDIKDKVVYVWDAGYPTNVTNLANDSFNLQQDILAAQTLFSSGVPLVYMPGFYIAQQLTLSQVDAENWFKNSGPIGEALYDRYMNNPLFPWYGKDKNNLLGQVWNIWDMINVAWLIASGGVSSQIVPSVKLTNKCYWKKMDNPHIIREGYYTTYNKIFPEFVKQLQEYEKGNES